jgi:catechol 2,3-dioxygenase-like lactoylglutathione lyase family enzyme
VRLDHAGLSVADLDAAVAFWARAFGFEVEFAFSLGEIRGVMLRGEEGRVELFERPGSAGGLRAQDPIAALATRGYGHVALCASDIEAPFARAVEAGATPKVTPRPSPEPGIRFAFLADPEGNLVELVERP